MKDKKLQQLYDFFLRSSGVSTDSRRITHGCLFFALKGDQFNGNQFAGAAIEHGAMLAVADDPALEKHPEVFMVENALEALQQLATHHRQLCQAKVIGITGSNGKTTSKELVASVLSTKFNIVSTAGNLNNHIGVPLTLLRIKPETELAVVEMGANHVGEIEALCNIARPDYGLITNIGKAHLEGFGGIQGVVKAKTELYKFLKAHDGLVFLNHNDQLLQNHAKDIRQYTYGTSTESDVRGTLLESKPFVGFEWSQGVSEAYKVLTKIIGSYNLDNLLAAVAIGSYFGIQPALVNEALESYLPSNNRSQLIARNNFSIIMDAYNANPVSMAAAISNLAALGCERPVVILGDMLELGDESATEHRAILDLLSGLGIKQVYLIGKEFAAVSEPYGFQVFSDVLAFNNALINHSWNGTHILVKGSRGIRLELLNIFSQDA
jgi:UDP-N-acetylmuramoyl-tripeptide--D-alanyl-D-alanine ligase